MRDAWLELDDTLKDRIRLVLEDPERLVTEAELRKLSEEGRGLARILAAELQRLEHRLGELDADPATSLAAIGPAFRRVHDFREHLAELDGLFSALGSGTAGADVAAPAFCAMPARSARCGSRRDL